MSVLAAVDTWDVPSAAVVVVGPQGVIDRHGPTAAPQRIASVTKLVTAYAVLLAVSEGAVELDEPAGPDGAAVRHLLAHTAGYGFESEAPVVAAPGSRRIYSNRGFEELARHVESRTGIPFAEYAVEAVLGPLGMEHTRAEGSPAFGMTSTVDDLARLAAELLAPRLLPPFTVAESVAVQFPGLDGVLPGVGRFSPLDWGLGAERNFGRAGHWAGPSPSPDAFGHFGGAGSFLWVDPPAGIACACLTGRDFGPWALEVWPGLCAAVLQEYGRHPVARPTA